MNNSFICNGNNSGVMKCLQFKWRRRIITWMVVQDYGRRRKGFLGYSSQSLFLPFKEFASSECSIPGVTKIIFVRLSIPPTDHQSSTWRVKESVCSLGRFPSTGSKKFNGKFKWMTPLSGVLNQWEETPQWSPTRWAVEPLWGTHRDRVSIILMCCPP